MLTDDPAFQAPREPLPPAVGLPSIRLTLAREGRLRARTAPRGERIGDEGRFVELALLMIQQNRFEDAIAALRGRRAPRSSPDLRSGCLSVVVCPCRRRRHQDTDQTDTKPVYPPIAQSARVRGGAHRHGD
jgi:hypothetical protein